MCSNFNVGFISKAKMIEKMYGGKCHGTHAHSHKCERECEEINFKHSEVKITFHLGVAVSKYFKFLKQNYK
jgi:hypothetical protein